MASLNDVIAYFCLKYPFKDELSKARLTKLVYLADWMSALVNDRQMTQIKWLFNHYGPYVDDVIDAARSNNDFKIKQTQNIFGGYKEKVVFAGDEDDLSLSQKEKAILDVVIEKTKSMYFNAFIDYVYSTYPVKSNRRYSYLDLVSLAREFKETSRSE
jgi:hypothetical protein